MATVSYATDPATGLRIGNATVSWDADTLDSTGTLNVNVAQYQVWVSTNGGTSYVQATSVPGTQTSAVLPAYRAGTTLTIGIIAVGDNGIASDMSSTITVTIDVDSTPPPVPSTLTVAASLGGISITWDGKDNTGTAMSVATDRVSIEMSASATFASGVSVVASVPLGAQKVFVPGSALTYGTTYYFRARSLGVEGVNSSYSSTASVTAVAVVSAEIDAAVTGAIASAQSDATSALTTANGKNKIIFSASNPSGSGTTGDLWFKTSSGIIIGQWQWNGSAWTSTTIDNAVIANLDAGKITTGSLSAARISANSITADKLTLASTDNLCDNPQFLNGNTGWTLTGGSHAVNATAARNGGPADVITHTSGTANTIKSSKWAATQGIYFRYGVWVKSSVTTTSGQVVVQQITTDTSGTVTTATAVSAPALTANTWTLVAGVGPVTVSNTISAQVGIQVVSGTSSGTLTVDQVIVTRAADANLVVDGTITGAKIAANTITAGNIATGTITAASGVIGSIDASTITTGTLSASHIGAGTLTADLISFGSLDNLIENPQFKYGSTGWSLAPTMSIVTGHSRVSGANALKVAHVNGTRDALVDLNDWDVEGGEWYKFIAWINTGVALANADISLGIVWTLDDGTFFWDDRKVFGSTLTVGTYTRVNCLMDVVVPDHAVKAHARFYVEDTAPTGTIYLDSIACIRAIDNSLLDLRGELDIPNTLLPPSQDKLSLAIDAADATIATTGAINLRLSTPTGGIGVYAGSTPASSVPAAGVFLVSADDVQLGIPFGSCSKTTGSSMASSTSFSEQLVDTDVQLSNGMVRTSGRLVVPVAGVYHVTVGIQYPGNATGTVGVAIGVNGSAIASGAEERPSSSAANHLIGTFPLPLSAGDTLSVFGLQNSGSSVTPSNVKVTAFKIPV